MKRGGPLRRTPMKRTAMKRKTTPPKGRSTHSGFPPEVREAALARDLSCRAWAMGFALDVRCSGRLHCHHRILRGQGGPDTLDNALMICEAHHLHAHDVDRAAAEATGIIMRRHSSGSIDLSSNPKGSP